MLLGEVADEIDWLNDRPDSTGRCLHAVKTFLADPTEGNRRIVRDRYLAIPEHLRTYALGDMDRKDTPLRILITDLGEHLHGWPDGPVVTQQKLAIGSRTRSNAVQLGGSTGCQGVSDT